jgi:uncharacterized membrane protein YqjE
MFSLFRDKNQKSVLREEAAAAVLQARNVAQRTVEHGSALAALFSAELKEYTVHQVRRLVMLVVACVLLLGAYGVLCALLAVALGLYIGIVCSLAVVVVLNILVAGALLYGAVKMGGKKLAPATVEELRNDWQCLKLLFKESSKQ